MEIASKNVNLGRFIENTTLGIQTRRLPSYPYMQRGGENKLLPPLFIEAR
jgi:hypothetical protein